MQLIERLSPKAPSFNQPYLGMYGEFQGPWWRAVTAELGRAHSSFYLPSEKWCRAAAVYLLTGRARIGTTTNIKTIFLFGL